MYTALKPEPSYEEYKEKLEKNLSKVYGVSFGKEHINDVIKLTLFFDEEKEKHILERLKREGKDGIITRMEKNIYTYEKEIFDGNEMMPWVKTFTGRILSFESNNDYLTNKFYFDMKKMMDMYCD